MVNKAEYGMQNSDIALVIVVRYRSAAFGYNDFIWEKYGAAISKQIGFTDPKTKEAPKTNLMASPEGGERGSLVEMAKTGVRLAVCNTATKNLSGNIARATGGDADKIYADLKANLLPGGRLVPAGIVAVGRAQERGYSLVTV
jgi:intracellular sulfur oxidation DsrE/DsrF family protein